MEKFRNLGISEGVINALIQKGFEEPTPIQEAAIPLLLQGTTDIVGHAQTGTGKTAAFGIPIIEKAEERSKHVQAIVLAPTRELAIQVADEMNGLKGDKKLSIVPIYGGQSMQIQNERLRKGIDVVVGTPGRVLDHLERKRLDLSHVKYIVLDEADEMLNMGFVEDVERIMESAPKERQMLLFSATMPNRILQLAKKYMGKYELISVKKENLTTPLTDQIYFEVRNSDKFDALCRIIDVEKEFYGLVFCRTRIDTGELAQKLEERGYGAEALHGEVSQAQREKILTKFRKRKIHILAATDVAARGIDITDLTHVINYSLPQDPEAYVHRIGRTGRAGKQGTAITFITPSEFSRLAFIKKTAKADIRKGELPGHKEVLESRMKRVKDDIGEIISKAQLNDYKALASELLEQYSPEDAVAALLKQTFKGDLQPERMDPVQRRERSDRGERDRGVDTTGKTRLFVAMGKKDKLTEGKLAQFIEKETGLDASALGGIEIYDNFSFVNAPFEEAEMILSVFSRKEGRTLVEKAKASKDQSGTEAKGVRKWRRDEKPAKRSSFRDKKKSFAKKDRKRK